MIASLPMRLWIQGKDNTTNLIPIFLKKKRKGPKLDLFLYDPNEFHT
jgi:hypothetical protein